MFLPVGSKRADRPKSSRWYRRYGSWGGVRAERSDGRPMVLASLLLGCSLRHSRDGDETDSVPARLSVARRAPSHPHATKTLVGADGVAVIVGALSAEVHVMRRAGVLDPPCLLGVAPGCMGTASVAAETKEEHDSIRRYAISPP